MVKNIKIILITMVFILIMPLTALAGVKVLVDGKELSSNNEPVFVSGKLMVPMRSIFECLGAQVNYSNGNIIAIMDKVEISLQVNQTLCKINNRPDIIPVPPLVQNGATLVPLRFISQALQADVDYLNEHQLVLITSPKYKKGLESNDKNLVSSVKKYNIYKNLSLTREKDIAIYRELEQELHKNVNGLKELNKSINEFILDQDPTVISIAINKKETTKNMNAEISYLSARYYKNELTMQLGKDLTSYYTLVNYIYDIIANEKGVSSVIQGKIIETKNAENAVVGDIITIEQKINNYLAEDLSGI